MLLEMLNADGCRQRKARKTWRTVTRPLGVLQSLRLIYESKDMIRIFCTGTLKRKVVQNRLVMTKFSPSKTNKELK